MEYVHSVSLMVALDVISSSVAIEVKELKGHRASYVGRPVVRTTILSIVLGHWTEDVFLFKLNPKVGVTNEGELVMINDRGVEKLLMPLLGAPFVLPRID